MFARSKLSLVLTATMVTACSSSSASSEAGGAIDCSAASVEGVAAAAKEEEGPLEWYAATRGLEGVAAAFTDKYGIKVNLLSLNTTEVNQRFASEASAGAPIADVLLTGKGDFIPDALSKGWLTPLKDANIPGYPWNFPTDFIDGPAVSVQSSPFGIAFNTELVQSPPQSWADLLNPEWKGRIGLTDPRSSSTFIDLYDALDKEEGDDYLSKLGDQISTTFGTGPEAVQSLAAGEVELQIASSAGLVGSVASQGAPVKFIAPPTTAAFTTQIAIASSTTHPQSACLFVAYLMGEEGNELIAKLRDAPSMYTLAKTGQRLLESDGWDTDRQDEIVKALSN